MKRLRLQKRQAVAGAVATGIILIGLIGLYAELRSRAATMVFSKQAESGTLAGGSSAVISDSKASAGKAVKFENTPPILADFKYDTLTYRGSVQATMAAVPANKSIGFGVKTYYLIDFLPNTALTESQSMIGSGIDKTVIQLKANSSTQLGRDNRGYQGDPTLGVTCPLRIVSSDGSLIQDLTIRGTTQDSSKKGDGLGIYHGLKLTGTNPVVQRVKVAHIPGAGSANPQETFSISWNQNNNVKLNGVIVDGENVAASLIGSSRSDNTTVTGGEYMNTKLSTAFAWYKSNNAVFTNNYIHDVKKGYNFEVQTGNTTITKPKFRNITGGTDIAIANNVSSGNFTIIDPDTDVDPTTKKARPLEILVTGYSGQPRTQDPSAIHVMVNGRDVTNIASYVHMVVKG